jgi:uncharacterized protein (DUF1810 family)
VNSEAFDLERFVAAQAPVFPGVLNELRSGRKRTHWMWFVFPQLSGLGSSAMAEKYAIVSLEEARAYLSHPILGQRLELCTRAVLGHAESSLHDIFGSPDDMKFRSSMTLFAIAAGAPSLYAEAVERVCDGQMDQRTMELLRA